MKDAMDSASQLTHFMPIQVKFYPFMDGWLAKGLPGCTDVKTKEIVANAL